MLIDRRVFLDIRITRRNVGFRLIVVVIGYEVFDRVIGEELPHLSIKLGSESLVRCQDQSRSPKLGDDMSHRKGLPGTGDTKQCLERLAGMNTLKQFTDCLRLVTRRFKVTS